MQDRELITCNLFDGEQPPSVAAVDGVVITGSPAFLTDYASWNYIGAEFLRQAFEAQIPILGICYGHQLLAWAFGGAVDFNPRGREIGTVTIRLTAAARSDALFSDFPEQLEVQVSHLQSVVQLPPGAELLAGNEFDPMHGFRLGDRTWGLQFHPEFTADITRAYIRERAENLSAEGFNPELLMGNVRDTALAASLLKRFAGLVSSSAAKT